MHLRPVNQAARIGCAILAARVERAADREGPRVSLGERPLVETMTVAACHSRVARTAVIVGSRADDVATAVSRLPIDIISNPLWPEGLASSVRSAVGWARGRHCDGLVLATVDGATLSAALLDALIVASDGAQQLAAFEQGGTLGLPALFPRSCYSRLEGLAGDVDARAILRGADPELPILGLRWPPTLPAQTPRGASPTVPHPRYAGSVRTPRAPR